MRLENCLAIDLVEAWRIHHLTMLGRMDPQAPCTVFFRDPEWRALYSWYHHTTQIPATPPTLRDATRWIAIKGGFQGRKSDGHPGAQVMWHGLQNPAPVPHLASHLLRRMSCRLSADRQALYAHPIQFLATFIDPERFRGTSCSSRLVPAATRPGPRRAAPRTICSGPG